MRKILASCALFGALLPVTYGVAAIRGGAEIVSARLIPPIVGFEEIEGVRIRYVVSAPANVELQLSRQSTGILVKSVCLPVRPELRGKPPCRLFQPLRKLVVQAREAGAHVLAFSRLMSEGRLAPGVYQVRVRTLVQAQGIVLSLTVHR